MEIRPLTDIDFIKNVYRTRLVKDFPFNERRPWRSVKKLWRAGRYDCWGMFDGEELLAYAFFASLTQDGGRYGLFDYLAVSRERRGEGIGSAFIRGLAERLTDLECVIGEVEDPDAAEDAETAETRRRRLDFYLHADWRDTGVRAHVYGVDYRLLEVPVGSTHTPKQTGEIYTAIYRSFLPEKFLKLHFRLYGPRE